MSAVVRVGLPLIYQLEWADIPAGPFDVYRAGIGSLKINRRNGFASESEALMYPYLSWGRTGEMTKQTEGQPSN